MSSSGDRFERSTEYLNRCHGKIIDRIEVHGDLDPTVMDRIVIYFSDDTKAEIWGYTSSTEIVAELWRKDPIA